MSNGVSQVMREGANGKSIFIDGARVAKHPSHKITRTDIVRKVAEELLAKGIVAHVLHGGAAIGIGMRLAQLLLSGTGEFRQQERPDRVVPRQIDQFFMGKNGVSSAVGGEQGRSQQQGHSATRCSSKSPLSCPDQPWRVMPPT